MATENNKPIQTFRLRGVKVSVFANKTDQGVFHKVALQRVYREGEEWKTTQSLGRDDLPVAILLLQQAWEFILETESGFTVTHSVTSQTYTAAEIERAPENVGIGPPPSATHVEGESMGISHGETIGISHGHSRCRTDTKGRSRTAQEKTENEQRNDGGPQ
jgi:hypothetical protein